jgi:hypothetical protein
VPADITLSDKAANPLVHGQPVHGEGSITGSYLKPAA